MFFHIYRTGGTSVIAALQEHGEQLQIRTQFEQLLNRLPRIAPISLLRPKVHAHADELKRRLPPETFGSYFKFAFVRNPWDWQVSVYSYVTARPKHPYYLPLKALGSFERYIEALYLKDRYLLRTERQSDFLYDAQGALLADFVGRFERLEQDFAAVTERLGIQAQLPKLNASEHQPYRSCYTGRTRRLIEEIYREDIERFGYTF